MVSSVRSHALSQAGWSCTRAGGGRESVTARGGCLCAQSLAAVPAWAGGGKCSCLAWSWRARSGASSRCGRCPGYGRGTCFPGRLRAGGDGPGEAPSRAAGPARYGRRRAHPGSGSPGMRKYPPAGTGRGRVPPGDTARTKARPPGTGKEDPVFPRRDGGPGKCPQEGGYPGGRGEQDKAVLAVSREMAATRRAELASGSSELPVRHAMVFTVEPSSRIRLGWQPLGAGLREESKVVESPPSWGLSRFRGSSGDSVGCERSGSANHHGRLRRSFADGAPARVHKRNRGSLPRLRPRRLTGSGPRARHTA